MVCFHCHHLANCGSHSGRGLAGELPSYWEFVLKRTERRVKADGGESTRRNKKQGQETHQRQLEKFHSHGGKPYLSWTQSPGREG